MGATGGRALADGMMNQDPYFKKVIPFVHGDVSLTFRVSQDLFSSYDVDVGTRFLLRTLATEGVSGGRAILDLGCGYGPIGLTLGKVNKDAEVHMVDRDALAVECARQNAELNELPDAQVYGSLGYYDVRKSDFDLIVSNIPAKAGEPVVTHLLRGAAPSLAPGGLVAVVVVTRLEAFVEHPRRDARSGNRGQAGASRAHGVSVPL
ncbi:MAG: methyltransferase [Chloroflexia bacterium]